MTNDRWFQAGVRHVPSTVVVGRHGHEVSPAYTEIPCTEGSIRIYPDRVVVGPRGQAVVMPGRTEIVGPRTPDRTMTPGRG